MNDSVAKVET